jgi:hypothetical protein
MKYALLLGYIAVIAVAVFGFNSIASGSSSTIGDISHSLKSGTTAFTAKFDSPHKLTLFPEAQKVKTSYSIVCLKGRTVSTNARTFTTPFTRNLLYGIPSKQDVCYLSVAAATSKPGGQIVVEARIR